MTDDLAPERTKLREFHIRIDRVEFRVEQEEMTGAQLRQLPSPSIGPDRDLFEVIPGQADRKIGDTDVVELANGKRFFTAPAHINPGICMDSLE
jgi:multiubiquitin